MRKRNRSRILATCLLVSAGLAGGTARATSEVEYWSVDADRVALGGYSPVSYFQVGKAEKGSPEFAVEHAGVTFHLTSYEQVLLFEAAPQRYVPAHGGWCSAMMAGSGNRVAANPAAFKVVDGKLLLFFYGDWDGNLIDGPAIWEEKGGDAQIGRADATWEAILEGRRQSRIITQ